MMSVGLACFVRSLWAGDPTRRLNSSWVLDIVDRASLEGFLMSHTFFGKLFVGPVDELRISWWPHGHKHRYQTFIAGLGLVLRWRQQFPCVSCQPR